MISTYAAAQPVLLLAFIGGCVGLWIVFTRMAHVRFPWRGVLVGLLVALAVSLVLTSQAPRADLSSSSPTVVITGDLIIDSLTYNPRTTDLFINVANTSNLPVVLNKVTVLVEEEAQVNITANSLLEKPTAVFLTPLDGPTGSVARTQSKSTDLPNIEVLPGHTASIATGLFTPRTLELQVFITYMGNRSASSTKTWIVGEVPGSLPPGTVAPVTNATATKQP